jgi:mxaJ protein
VFLVDGYIIMTALVSEAKKKRRYFFALGGGALLLLSLNVVSSADPLPSSSATAAPAAADSGALRVCASANQLPYSAKGGDGFENKIAAVVADAMGRPVEFVWIDRPAIYLVRDFLDKNTCDVIIGLDTGDDRVLTTKPYYRAGYVFITRAANNLDIHSWNDPRLKAFNHIAVGFGTPGEVMLKEIGKYDDDFNYERSLVNFRSNRNQYIQVDPSRMVEEVADGNADIAVGFSPEVARYVHDSKVPLRMTPVDDDTVKSDGQKVPQAFDQSMGVRKTDPQLKASLDDALIKAKPEIDKILKAEGIPLLEPRS